jgi:membrane protease YdiL (CAAX protease family)
MIVIAPPPFLPVLLSSLVHHTRRSSTSLHLIADVLLTVILWRCPPRSILALWRWAILVATQWTKIPGVDSIVRQSLIRGGPLGPGCGKMVEILTVCWLWRLAYPDETLPISLGPLPSRLTWGIVLVLCILTNWILSLWSNRTQSRGAHSGVHTMVDELSQSRPLSRKEHFELLSWAIVNATCEEAASRGIWMHEFQRRGNVSFLFANVLQAISFGVWHFRGIPSGWTGVGLTFVYGFAMGLIMEHGGGLLLPIVAHSIADYFIFAVIARQGKFK